jgi:hypothetical protein
MSSPHERGALAGRWYGPRLAAGNALFGGGLAAIVFGAWLAIDARMLTLGIIGGIVLFALADLVAPPKNNI